MEATLTNICLGIKNSGNGLPVPTGIRGNPVRIESVMKDEAANSESD